jgi:hypothetical protein
VGLSTPGENARSVHSWSRPSANGSAETGRPHVEDADVQRTGK